MTNQALEDIKKFAVERLKREYGYAGLADGDQFAMINSGGDGENLIVKIEAQVD